MWGGWDPRHCIGLRVSLSSSFTFAFFYSHQTLSGDFFPTSFFFSLEFSVVWIFVTLWTSKQTHHYDFYTQKWQLECRKVVRAIYRTRLGGFDCLVLFTFCSHVNFLGLYAFPLVLEFVKLFFLQALTDYVHCFNLLMGSKMWLSVSSTQSVIWLLLWQFFLSWRS